MSDRIVEMIERSDGQRRAYIVQRDGGSYSFREQRRDDGKDKRLSSMPWPEGYIEEFGWLTPGLYCGFYDSAETAKWEALCKIEWLASAMPAN